MERESRGDVSHGATCRFRERNLLESKLDEGFWQGNQGQPRAIKCPAPVGLWACSLPVSSANENLYRTWEARPTDRKYGRCAHTFLVLTQRPEDFRGVKHVVPIHDPDRKKKWRARCRSHE